MLALLPTRASQRQHTLTVNGEKDMETHELVIEMKLLERRFDSL